MLAKELRQSANAEVFIDIESVALGEDFQQAIEREVAHRQALDPQRGEDPQEAILPSRDPFLAGVGFDRGGVPVVVAVAAEA